MARPSLGPEGGLAPWRGRNETVEEPRPLSARRASAVGHAAVLEERLRSFQGDLTVADAAARGGLALRDAEAALVHLSSEYRGHLKATESGELLFSFPHGLVKPAAQGKIARTARAVGRALSGAGRFVVRAWVSVVMVGYALALGALLVAWAMKDDRDGVGDTIAVVLRVVVEALFWTFHPFSPVYWDREPAWMRARRHTRKVPFYEKVNRFVFGPSPPAADPRLRERQLIAEIRRQDGRIGPGDIMRITGTSREEAEALLCRLVLDYDGEIEVSDEGAVVYRFSALRKTADTALEPVHARPAEPIWTKQEVMVPLTGNSPGTNVLLGAINGFNLAASGFVLANDLTVDRIAFLMSPQAAEAVALPPTGTPVLLGVVPFVFSTALFALPMARLLRRGTRARATARENARRSLLRAILESGGDPVEAVELEAAWQRAGGPSIEEKKLTEEVRRLGGEPDVTEEGRIVYRFPDFAREVAALTSHRRAAPAAERSVGEVIFSSEPDDRG